MKTNSLLLMCESRYRPSSRVSTTMCNTALTKYGKKERKITDRYEANITVMEPVTDAKRYALVNFKRDPSKKKLNTLRAGRNKVKQTAQRCANNYWLQLCQSIKLSSNTGNIRGTYAGIKKATGPSIKNTAPLKTKTMEVITDCNKQMEKCV